MSTAKQQRFISPLPVTGPWDAVGLRRGQFLLVLGLSVALFVWIDGPVWRHLADDHLRRLVLSYVVIPLALVWPLGHNRTLTPENLLGATVMLAMIKLLVTAGLLAVLGMLWN